LKDWLVLPLFHSLAYLNLTKGLKVIVDTRYLFCLNQAFVLRLE